MLLILVLFLGLPALALGADFQSFIQSDLYATLLLWTSWKSWQFWLALVGGGVLWLLLFLGQATLEEKIQGLSGRARHESFLDVLLILIGGYVAVIWLFRAEALFIWAVSLKQLPVPPQGFFDWSLLVIVGLLALDLLYLLFNTLRRYSLPGAIFRLLTVPLAAAYSGLLVILAVLALSYIAMALVLFVVAGMLLGAAGEGLYSAMTEPARPAPKPVDDKAWKDPLAGMSDEMRVSLGIGSPRYPDGLPARMFRKDKEEDKS